MLLIIRGQPGSGKSELAKRLTQLNFTADSYPGLYRGGHIRRELVKTAHLWCRLQVEKTLRRLRNHEIVAVHNTFCQMWEIDPYIEMCQRLGHQYTVITVEGDHGSVHEVPDETLRLMKERWEPFVAPTRRPGYKPGQKWVPPFSLDEVIAEAESNAKA